MWEVKKLLVMSIRRSGAQQSMLHPEYERTQSWCTTYETYLAHITQVHGVQFQCSRRVEHIFPPSRGKIANGHLLIQSCMQVSHTVD